MKSDEKFSSTFIICLKKEKEKPVSIYEFMKRHDYSSLKIVFLLVVDDLCFSSIRRMQILY